MRKKLLVILGGLFSVLSASAQMPVPLLDAGPQGAQARSQLEAILLCKSGTKLSPKVIESQFQALGLEKGPDGVYLPARAGHKPSLFGDAVVAALVSEGAGEVKAAVYLASQSGKRMASKLNVLDVDEQANTDDASYFKKTGKKTTLLVGAASELSVGNATLKYQSAVTCQVIG